MRGPQLNNNHLHTRAGATSLEYSDLKSGKAPPHARGRDRGLVFLPDPY